MDDETKKEIDRLWAEYNELKKKDENITGEVLITLPKEYVKEVLDRFERTQQILLRVYELKFNTHQKINASPQEISCLVKGVQNIKAAMSSLGKT